MIDLNIMALKPRTCLQNLSFVHKNLFTPHMSMLLLENFVELTLLYFSTFLFNKNIPTCQVLFQVQRILRRNDLKVEPNKQISKRFYLQSLGRQIFFQNSEYFGFQKGNTVHLLHYTILAEGLGSVLYSRILLFLKHMNIHSKRDSSASAQF